VDVCALANGSEVPATTLAAKIRAAAFMTARWVMLCFAAPGMATSDNKVRAPPLRARVRTLRLLGFDFIPMSLRHGVLGCALPSIAIGKFGPALCVRRRLVSGAALPLSVPKNRPYAGIKSAFPESLAKYSLAPKTRPLEKQEVAMKQTAIAANSARS
jgi:hypothetical protein